jgi:hypothetical protein
MQTVISSSEVVGYIRSEGVPVQIWADATATYDAGEQAVHVNLESFGRHASAADGDRLRPDWLPQPERVSEHLPREEAADFAKDVFHSWVKKVRGSIPPELFHEGETV